MISYILIILFYGDIPKNDGYRLSDRFVSVVNSEKFQNISSAVVSTALILNQQAAPCCAIPPELGEQAAAANNVYLHPSLKPLGNTPAIPPLSVPPAPGPPFPGQPPIFMPIGRPVTPRARLANTVFFTGSFAYTCLNAYWGNPVALAGCSIMVATWFARTLNCYLPGG